MNDECVKKQKKTLTIMYKMNENRFYKNKNLKKINHNLFSVQFLKWHDFGSSNPFVNLTFLNM